jgi:predicted AlkP superfamily phosphohydrolase/phosphomutase
LHIHLQIVIGIDGFTWDIGHEFMAEGVMPNLAKLVANGCHGELESVIPFETSPAWSSFQTGCNPGKTSIFGFHRYDRLQKTVRLNSYSEIAVPSLWELADKSGKKVVSINMPVTSPPPKVNGVIIPGLLCPGLSESTVYPPEAYTKYIQHHKDYLIVNKTPHQSVRETAQQAIQTERVRLEVALEIMKDIEWDLFSIQIQSSDAIQHKIWEAINPKNKQKLPEDHKEALEFYRYCDTMVGKIIEEAGENVLTIIASDHGFGDSKACLNVNAWLRQKGYLKLLSQDEEKTKWEKIKTKFPIIKMAARQYGKLKKVDKNLMKNRLFCQKNLVHLRKCVDLESTIALCLSGLAGTIYLTAEPANRQEISNQIKTGLLEDFGPGSKQHLISKISTGQEVYGKEIPQTCLPDLVVEFETGYNAAISPTGTKLVDDTFTTGTHRKEGIFVMSGPNIRAGHEMHANLIDIAPTVLAHLGIAVPNHMDGKVLVNAFAVAMDVKYEDVTIKPDKSSEYTNDEQADVEKQLRDLGYL